MKGHLSLNLLRNFKMVELTKVMRQIGDGSFISLSNKIWKEKTDNNAEKALISKLVSKNDLSYPRYRVSIFTENNVEENKIEKEQMN